MSVLIGDVNDNVPRFTQPAFEVTLSEGTPVGTTVTRVEAEDPDIASSLSYSFVSDGAYEIQFIILVLMNSMKIVIPLHFIHEKRLQTML